MSKVFEHGYAVVIGAGGDLPNTVGDAQGIADVLRDPSRCAYPTEQVTLLTGPQATRVGVLNALDQLVAAAGPKDTVIIYFSGHGYQVAGPTGTFYYLLPFGYNLATLYQTAISGTELQERLTAIEAARVVLLLDCCHAGGFDEAAKTPGLDISKAPIPEEVLASFGSGEGRVLIASSQADELSYAGKPYSVFTLALLEALSGQGVSRRDGYVRVVDLALRAREVVPQRTGNRQHPILDFADADNFPVAYYAAGDKTPKAPLVTSTSVEQWPGEFRGFNQQGQQVFGNQTNVTGNVGELFSGTFQGPLTIYRGPVYMDGQPIDWSQVEDDYQRALGRITQRFVDHMKISAGAQNEQQALQRYRPPRLQEAQIRAVSSGAALSQLNDQSLQPGESLVITGDAGSGKSTFLLYQSYTMAQQAKNNPQAPLPLYLSLRTFAGDNRDDLLNALAQANDLPVNLVRALWFEERRPLVLLLDGADEAPGALLETLATAVDNLIGGNTRHNLLISSRPGRFRELLAARRSNLREWLIMPLNASEIDALLDSYDQSALKALVAQNSILREVLQSPDLIAALAQSASKLTQGRVVPTNAGRIYQLLMRRRFEDVDTYDYERVIKPTLATLAYQMIREDRATLENDDALLDRLSELLLQVEQRYLRRRIVLPDQWQAQDLLKTLCDSGVLESPTDRPELISFSKTSYRDYFAAVEIERLGIDTPEISADLALGQREAQRWTQPLILLLGFQPKAARLFDKLYATTPLSAAQFWFETRPQSETVPSVLSESYINEQTQLQQQLSGRDDEPTTRVFYRWINQFGQPQQRLLAVAAISQWGLNDSSLVRLLDAADDDHPLVRANAEYALLRMGEAAPYDPPRPCPPLFDIDGKSVRFRAFGGCRAVVGPLSLIDIPLPNTIYCDVQINDVGINLFEQHSNITVDAPLPEFLLSQSLETFGYVNWLGIVARFAWIANYSEQTAQKADARGGPVQQLAQKLHERAQRYAALGRLLAADLIGSNWKDIPDVQPNVMIEQAAQQSYLKIRQLFIRANQTRMRELSAQSQEFFNRRPEPSTTKFSGKQTRLAFENEPITLDAEGLSATTGNKRFTHYNVSQNVPRISNHSLIGVEFASIHGIPDPMPIVLRVNAVFDAERISNGGELIGVRINKLEGGNYGWKPRCIIRVGRLADGKIAGVVLKQRATLS